MESSEYTVAEFCRRHGACASGSKWALANCETMADVWATARPDRLVWVATRHGVMCRTDRLRFLAAVLRQCEHHMADDRSLAVIASLDSDLAGESVEWRVVRAAANAACAAANAYAADAAAYAAAYDAYAAAYAAAYDAAYAAADADAESVRAEQAAWLRGNVTPNFSRTP